MANMIGQQGGLKTMLSTHGGARHWLLGPRVCLSRSVTAIFRGDRGVTLDASNFIRPLDGRFVLPKDTYMGSVYKAIAVYWHQTLGQLRVPAAGPDTRKRDQLDAAVRRTRDHGDDPTDSSPYARVRRGGRTC
jgi:hypothetical protein